MSAKHRIQRTIRVLAKPPLSLFERFFELESASGFCLMAMTVLGMVWANSPWEGLYQQVQHIPVNLPEGLGHWGVPLNWTILQWLDDGLMTVFFLLVGLELKREMISGELASLRKSILPILAALGGMIAPALIFYAINVLSQNQLHQSQLRGWAIPTATDIAFSLAVLKLVGNGVPLSLRVFLTALAIADDLGAVLVIAAFYGHGIAGSAMMPFLLTCGGGGMLHFFRIRWIWPYLVLGLILWLTILPTGVHPTLSGVLMAAFIPAPKPLEKLDHSLHPIVAYGILPLFALMNAGVSITHFSLEEFRQMLLSPLMAGVILGLLLGKPLGILAASQLAIRLKLAEWPTGINRLHTLGIGFVAAIGFTMSIFIANLAFVKHPQLLMEAKIGIILASLIAGFLGVIILKKACRGSLIVK